MKRILIETSLFKATSIFLASLQSIVKSEYFWVFYKDFSLFQVFNKHHSKRPAGAGISSNCMEPEAVVTF